LREDAFNLVERIIIQANEGSETKQAEPAVQPTDN
jgi:hypothetical protein